MNDQQGNVIDGTARARQWRGSKSKVRSGADETEARADAPKSFAGSLLVPAEMLTPASPPEERVNGSTEGRTENPPQASCRTADELSAQTRLHENPFLVPDAAQLALSVRRARRPLIALLIARTCDSLAVLRVTRRRAMSRSDGRRGRCWSRVWALGVVVGAVLVVAVTVSGSNTSHPSSSSSLRTGGEFNARGQGVLTALSSPFSQRAAVRDRASRPLRRARVKRRLASQRRPHSAGKSAVVPARYTPPSSPGTASTMPSQATPAYADSTPTAVPSQPAPSSGGATMSSSSSAGSRPAFGENGTLGPGHSPNS
jgi:hypothetical protein